MLIEYKMFFGFVFLFTLIGCLLSMHYCGVFEANGKKDQAIASGILALFFAFLSVYTCFFFIYALLYRV